MTAERTESEAVRGVLTIYVGGEPIVLPTHKIESSEKWLDQLGRSLGSIQIPDQADPQNALSRMLRSGTTTMLDLIVAYDYTGVLPPLSELRDRMTQREVKEAMEVMVNAENPLDEGIGPSVVGAFGRQTQMVEVGLRVTADLMNEATSALFQQASSTSSPLPSGDSTPPLSVVGSRKSSSSSSGATTRRARRAS